MKIAAVAASDVRTEIYRITDGGQVTHRWLEREQLSWTPWTAVPFRHNAIAICAISGYPEQIEVFILDNSGRVWNRWWWPDRGWTPLDEFNPLGRPFQRGAVDLSAFSAGDGYFDCFVGTDDGQIAVLPHLPGPDGATWRRCQNADALGDGWWPALTSTSARAFRSYISEPPGPTSDAIRRQSS